MRIAISAYGPDLNARIANRLGTSPYIVVIDPATMAFEAISNPGAFGGRGSGIHANVLVISKQVDVVITGYCSPMVEKYLTDNGILLVTGITGTVQDAVEKYKTEELWKYQRIEAKPGMKEIPRDRTAVAHALRHSMRQFAGLLPALVSVVFLLGLFNSFVSRKLLSSIFSGNGVLDTLWGACFGSIVAGNPINSYIIGGELLSHGVSLYAVTALIVTWVSVGLVQLPAEIAALGKRFALIRTSMSFVVSIAVAIITVVVVNTVAG